MFSDIKNRLTTLNTTISSNINKVIAFTEQTPTHEIKLAQDALANQAKNASLNGIFKMGIDVEKKKIYLDSKNLTVLEIVLFCVVCFLLISILVFVLCLFKYKLFFCKKPVKLT